MGGVGSGRADLQSHFLKIAKSHNVVYYLDIWLSWLIIFIYTSENKKNKKK